MASAFPNPADAWATTWARIIDLCADVNGAPLVRTDRRAGLGAAGRRPRGWRRIQARWLTCLLLRAVQRRRVESLVLGALSSSPVHRALVLVLGTNIAVLLDCSKSSRQCSLPSLLTLLTSLVRLFARYLARARRGSGGAHGSGERSTRPRRGATRRGKWTAGEGASPKGEGPVG